MTLARRCCYVLIVAFVTLVQFPAFTPAQEAKPSWSMPSDVKSELINGYRIAYKDEGQGTAIVFIHGAYADYRSFGPQIAALASSYRVTAHSYDRSSRRAFDDIDTENISYSIAN